MLQSLSVLSTAWYIMINVTAVKVVFWIYLSIATLTSGWIRTILIPCMPPLYFRTNALLSDNLTQSAVLYQPYHKKWNYDYV